MEVDTPLLLADDREKDDKRLAALQSKRLFKTEVRRLEVGDYQLCVGDVPVYAMEFKSIADFSNDKGMDLWQKLDAISNFAYPMLVLQGQMDEAARQRNPKWRFNRGAWEAAKAQTDAAIASILESRKVAILFVADEEEFAYWMGVFAKRLVRERREYQRPVETRKPAKRTLTQEAEDMVVALSGVGRKAAAQLLRTFKSVRALANAPAASIEALDGFGKKTAQHIEEVFNHQIEETE